jgi:glycosyltransferase involved in cell wall biosynthesis
MKAGGIELINIVPTDAKHVGEGVYQTEEDIQYRLVRMDEYEIWEGGFFFRGLWKVILRERPDVIVTSIAHIRGFRWNLPAWLLVRLLGIKLIEKSIPFRIPLYGEVVRHYHDSFRSGMSSPSPFVERLLPGTSLSTPARMLKTVLNWLHYPVRWLSGSVTVKYNLWTKRLCYTLPDAHVCYIEEAFDIIGSYGVPKEQIFITNNSPDTDRLLAAYRKLQAEGVPRHPHRLIHIGRLIEWKRVDVLIRALKRVQRTFPDADLLVAGNGPKESEWKQVAADLGMASSVKFLGGVYDLEVLGRHLMSSAVYVLAGMGGLSINEAMCFGLPTICSVCDGTEKKLVFEGRNGSYFKDGDEADLAAKIMWMFEHPEVMSRMGAESLRIIQEEVNVHTVVREYLRAFASVTGKH